MLESIRSSSFRDKPTPPPPLPPHGVPVVEEPIEDYRPPVPPHRNIDVVMNSNSLESTPQRKHHHHHHRNSKQQQEGKHHNRTSNEFIDSKANGGQFNVKQSEDEDFIIGATSQEPMRSVFEFDDEPPKNEEVKMRVKQEKNKEDDIAQFVQYPKTNNSNGIGECNNSVKPCFCVSVTITK